MHHTGVQQGLRKGLEAIRGFYHYYLVLKKEMYSKVNKCQKSLQPNTVSLAKQNTKLFMITAKQCAAAAALLVTGHTLSWLREGDFADSKMI